MADDAVADAVPLEIRARAIDYPRGLHADVGRRLRVFPHHLEPDGDVALDTVTPDDEPQEPAVGRALRLGDGPRENLPGVALELPARDAEDHVAYLEHPVRGRGGGDLGDEDLSGIDGLEDFGVDPPARAGGAEGPVVGLVGLAAPDEVRRRGLHLDPVLAPGTVAPAGYRDEAAPPGTPGVGDRLAERDERVAREVLAVHADDDVAHPDDVLAI